MSGIGVVSPSEADDRGFVRGSKARTILVLRVIVICKGGTGRYAAHPTQIPENGNEITRLTSDV